MHRRELLQGAGSVKTPHVHHAKRESNEKGRARMNPEFVLNIDFSTNLDHGSDVTTLDVDAAICVWDPDWGPSLS